MVSILSPGVYLIEKDISNYPPSIGATTVGIVGFATKGPTNKATLVTSQDNLVDTFGYPTESLPGQGLVGALEILETTNSMYFVRVASDDAANASATVSIGTCPAFAVMASGIGTTSGAIFKVQVTDNNSNTGFSEIKTYTVNPSAATTQQEALARVFGTDIDTLKVTAQFPYTYNADGTIKPANINIGSVAISADGWTEENIFDRIVQGFIVGSYAGSNAKLDISAFELDGSTLYSGLLFPVNTGPSPLGMQLSAISPSGFVPGGGLASEYVGGVAPGLTFSNLKYQVESLYPGTGYNLGFNDDKTARGNSLTITSFGGPQSKIIVNDSGGATESYRVSFKDSDYFITSVINETDDNAVSKYIKGSLYYEPSGAIQYPVSNPGKLTHFSDTVATIVAQPSAISYLSGASPYNASGARFVKLVDSTYALSGGMNGSPSAYVATVIGDSAAKTGIYALDDDLLNLTIALVPGLHEQAIQNALVTLAEETTNFMAVLSPPYAKTSVQDAIDWSNGFSEERTAPLNSSYAAIYWPHVQTFVPAFAKDTWLDPAIYGARQIVYTAATSQLWFAPAGFIRGRLTKPTAVEVRLGQGERDAMYSGGNAINPIVNFPQQGLTIFGQRTTQRNPTALDRINVRLLSIYIKKVLLASVQSYLFEPNDPVLWTSIEDTAAGILQPIKASRGIVEYRVKCDATTNTPDRVDRNELWCKVIVKPTKTAEAIVFELNLTSQSATIS